MLTDARRGDRLCKYIQEERSDSNDSRCLATDGVVVGVETASLSFLSFFIISFSCCKWMRLADVCLITNEDTTQSLFVS